MNNLNLKSFFNDEEIVGLDIDQDCVRVASVDLNETGRIVVKQLGSLDYAFNATNQTIASTIKSLWKALHIKTHTVRSCLRSPSLILKYFNYPTLEKKEIDSALGLEVEQLLQKPQEELFIDWHLYSHNQKFAKKEDKNYSEGIFVATRAEDMHKHLDILGMADLYPIVVDVGPMAMSNLFFALNKAPLSRDICLINVNNHNADIAILSQDSYIYPSNIYSQAPWQEKMDYLVDYVRDVLRYHQFKLHRPAVEKIVFSGSLSKDGKFQENFKQAIDSPMEFWNPFESENLTDKDYQAGHQDKGPAAAVCLGLALQSEKN